MGFFYNNNVAGPGVAKNGPKKKPFFRFWELFGNKFWDFFTLNFIYVLFCLPIITFGPATAAMTSMMRNIYLERPQFIFHDFWKAFKKNFKQSFVIGMLDVFAIGMTIFGYVFFTQWMDAEDNYWLFFALSMAAEVIFLLINFYIYPQIVALDLKMSAIIKNSVILAFVNLKGNLITLAFYLLYIVLLIIFRIYVLLFLPILPFGWLAFLTVFNSYPAIQKYIINPFYEANGQKNPELPEEEYEEAVFEDQGGKEQPLNLKKNGSKKGKVIK